MAFDVYNINDLQIELGYFASDVGQSFNQGKFLRINQSDFDNKREGDGQTLLDAGIQSNMVRPTKSGAYAMVARQVQEIVSVHSRPFVETTAHDNFDDDDEDIYSKFETLDEEEVAAKGLGKDQPVLTYLGAGLAILALVLSSFISTTGLTGIFTLLLAVAGSIMTVIGTIQFFKVASSETRKMSKVMHVILTVFSVLTVVMLGSSTFLLTNADPVTPNEVQADTKVDSEPTVEKPVLSMEELNATVEFNYDVFTAGADETGILRTGLPITLTNTSDQVWTYDIMVQAYNTNGDKVGDPDYILMANVSPEEPINYTIFEYITKEEADVLSQEGMTFKIESITPI